MTDPTEALFAKTPMGADLAEGLKTLSLDQKVTFTRYNRIVLPLDGYVFWINSNILSKPAMYNLQRFNATRANQPAAIPGVDNTLTAQCSVHVATDIRQEEASTIAVNRVVFTSLQEIQPLNEVSPTTIFIAEFDGIRFAFNSRASFYKQAGLWHYVGNAIYPTMESQIIDDIRGFSRTSLIVSNSLPAWLLLNGYNPPWPVPLPMPAIPLYPSFLVPDNDELPFGAVHISPADTKALQSFPSFDVSLNQDQLAMDRVVLTLWGANNAAATTMMSAIIQYSYDTGNFGLMSMPVIADEKVTQNELGILAQKKTIRFDVSYTQGTMRNVARQLILDCVPTIIFGDDQQIITST